VKKTDGWTILIPSLENDVGHPSLSEHLFEGILYCCVMNVLTVKLEIYDYSMIGCVNRVIQKSL
jgi:hypothetical protein